MDNYRDKKVVGMRAVNIIDFESPITVDEWEKYHQNILPKIDKAIYELGYKKGWGVCSPIYEDEVTTYHREPLTENDVLAESDVDVWELLGKQDQ